MKLIRRIIFAAVVLAIAALVGLKMGWFTDETNKKIEQGGAVAQSAVIEGFQQAGKFVPEDLGDKAEEFATCVVTKSWDSLSKDAKVKLASGTAGGLSVSDMRALADGVSQCKVN